MQPCDVLPSTPLPQDVSSTPAWIMWVVIAAAILAFEAWAVFGGHRTLSQAVQHGPLWVKCLFALGLPLLMFHLLVQR